MKLAHSSLLLLAGAVIGAQSTMRPTARTSSPEPAPEPAPDLPNYCGPGTIDVLPVAVECDGLPRTFKAIEPLPPHELTKQTIAHRQQRLAAGLVGRRRRA